LTALKLLERSVTVINKWRVNLIQHILRLGLSVLLVLVVAAAALPQTAKAASCKVYHTVQKGDKTGTIARMYGVKWIEIAAANDLERPTKLVIGDQLCIPFKHSVSLKNSIVVTNVNNLIKIKASDFKENGKYYVRVRDITSGAGKWYKIGTFKALRNKTVWGKYLLPKELKSSIYFEVCLKNATNNEVVCKNVRHFFRE
jgi:LysM repeat protein